MSESNLPFAPAAARNAEPILEVLRSRLPPKGRVVEIGAGTGQHAVRFSAALPGLAWLPTERADALPGLQARIRAEGGASLLPAQALDVLDATAWPDGPFQAAYSANTAHIMPWAAVAAMFEGLAPRLTPGAPFLLYGPFQRDGGHTAPSNEAFHESLRARDPGMGIRSLESLETTAARHQLKLEEAVPMPANNFIAVFVKNV